MHLDCVFSVLSDRCCIMLKDIMGESSPTRRLVDEYTRDPTTAKYKLTRWEVLTGDALWEGDGGHLQGRDCVFKEQRTGSKKGAVVDAWP
jgi:hypothetical protein